MASNLVVARGGVEFVPPISLAFWRWTLVFLILLPFTYITLKKNFKILGSAHNIKEIRLKERQKASLIFISSLFKKNKNYLGLYKFINLEKLTNIKIIALGGINRNNLKKLSLTSCAGFAGISYFK